MPIYEYRCRACGAKSSVFTRSMRDTPELCCPQCGGTDMARSFSSFVQVRSSSSGAAHIPRATPSAPDPRTDPVGFARYVEQGFEQTGEKMPDSLRELVKDARSGKLMGGQ